MSGIPIAIPNDLYYISNVESIKVILNEGLLPYVEEDIKEGTKENIKDKSILVCLNWDEMLALNSSLNLNEYAIFKINFKWLKINLIEDDTFDSQFYEAILSKEIEEEEYTQFSWLYERPVDRKRITYVGNVIRDKKDNDLWNLNTNL